jgi:hypothetical protein
VKTALVRLLLVLLSSPDSTNAFTLAGVVGPAFR